MTVVEFEEVEKMEPDFDKRMFALWHEGNAIKENKEENKENFDDWDRMVEDIKYHEEFKEEKPEKPKESNLLPILILIPSSWLFVMGIINRDLISLISGGIGFSFFFYFFTF